VMFLCALESISHLRTCGNLEEIKAEYKTERYKVRSHYQILFTKRYKVCIPGIFVLIK
jgi:hypothetical protein